LNDKNNAFLLCVHQYGFGGLQTYGCTYQEVRNYPGGVAAWAVQEYSPVNFSVA
jgi:hypothetical protein